MLAYKRFISLFAIGLFFGAATTVTLSRVTPHPQDAGSQRNVVVLRGERRVSLASMKAPMKEILASISLQTGYQFEAESVFDLEKGRYTVLVKNVLLRDLLDATGEVLGGRWDRTKDGYKLRPLSPKEVMEQTDRYEELVRRAGEFVEKVDPSKLAPGLETAFSGMKNVMQTRPIDAPVFPSESLPLLQILRTDMSIAIGYAAPGPNGTVFQSRGLMRVRAGSYHFGPEGGRIP